MTLREENAALKARIAALEGKATKPTTKWWENLDRPKTCPVCKRSFTKSGFKAHKRNAASTTKPCNLWKHAA